jgi:quinol-cytochrome oxidoreductase complex cytochrome b subunit
MRLFLKILVVLVAVYLLLLAGIFFLMLQPPLVFARAISKVPARAVFMLFPFKPLWYVARAGTLKIGDEAPDFQLHTRDTKEAVVLSSFRGRKPVVLVFGSYT